MNFGRRIRLRFRFESIVNKNIQNTKSNQWIVSTRTSSTAEESKLTENGEKLLYKGNQQFTVRTMFGLGCLNITYWGAQMVNNYFYKDVVVQGISLTGN